MRNLRLGDPKDSILLSFPSRFIAALPSLEIQIRYEIEVLPSGSAWYSLDQ